MGPRRMRESVDGAMSEIEAAARDSRITLDKAGDFLEKLDALAAVMTRCAEGVERLIESVEKSGVSVGAKAWEHKLPVEVVIQPNEEEKT